MELVDFLGFSCTLIYLYFVMRQERQAWYWSIAGSIFIAYSCITNQLYIQGILYLFYVGIAFIGLRKWRVGSSNVIQVSRMKLYDHLIFLSTSLLLGLLLGYLFDHFTEQQLPYLDGVISITAVGCTLLVVSKFRENWLYWMGINAASVYLYASQNLMVFTTMSILLFVVAWRGYMVWKNPSN